MLTGLDVPAMPIIVGKYSSGEQTSNALSTSYLQENNDQSSLNPYRQYSESHLCLSPLLHQILKNKKNIHETQRVNLPLTVYILERFLNAHLM